MVSESSNTAANIQFKISSTSLATSSSQQIAYWKPSPHKCLFHTKHTDNLTCNNVMQVESYFI